MDFTDKGNIFLLIRELTVIVKFGVYVCIIINTLNYGKINCDIYYFVFISSFDFMAWNKDTYLDLEGLLILIIIMALLLHNMLYG